MTSEFRMRRVVEFADTDMAGIVHFSNYFRYMEACEHAFFRSLGLSLHRQEGSEMIGLARVHAECQYLAPLHYQDEVEMHLVVREKRASSLTYDFTFSRTNGKADGERCARGVLTVVCVRGQPGVDRMRAAALPDEIARTIEAAPAVAEQVGSEKSGSETREKRRETR
jgi:YbgC/YbaW family acyl-CoA thioester hydrolase